MAAKPAKIQNAKSFIIFPFLVVVYIVRLVRITAMFPLTGVFEAPRHLGLPYFVIFMSILMFDTKAERF